MLNFIIKWIIRPTLYVHAFLFFLNHLAETKLLTRKRLDTVDMLLDGILVLYGALFYYLDIIYDIVFGSIWFLSFPEWKVRDKSFSSRLSSYMTRGNPIKRLWRNKLADVMIQYHWQAVKKFKGMRHGNTPRSSDYQ